MSTYTWTFDAPTGVQKNHALSDDLKMAAVAESVLMEYVWTVPGYGRNKGESVTIPRFSTIAEPTNALLSEGSRIPEDSFTVSSRAVTVSEYGRAVPYTNLARELTHFDLEQPIQRRLREQLSLVFDTVVSAALRATQIVYRPTTEVTFAISTTGVRAAAGSNLNYFHVETMRDYMYDTLFAKPYQGDDYIFCGRTFALRGVKRDPTFEEWHKYGDPEIKRTGETGRIENVVFVQSNHSQAFQSNSTCGEGVMFGDEAVAMAEVVSPELRAALPADFGRALSVAWYAILGFRGIWTDSGNPGEAKIIYFADSNITAY